MSRAWVVVGAVIATLGCAASATTAAPPDGSTTGNVTVRVGLGPLVPPEYRAGVAVRATDGTRVLDAVTDAAGYARFTVADGGRLDLTAAEPAHAAVSLLGVSAGFAGEVLLRSLAAATPAGVRDVTARVAVRGRSTPRAPVLLDGARGTTVTPEDAVTLAVPTWPGAPAARLTAFELDAASGFVNGWISPALDLAHAAVDVTVALPAQRARPTTMELRVEFPVVGRVTAASFGAVTSESVARYKYTENGAQLAPVGRSQLLAPGTPSFARWGVEAFEGELAPEVITASFTVAGTPALAAAVTTRPSFRGVVPAFAPVGRLTVTNGGLDVDVTGWSRAVFRVTVGAVVAWEGYGVTADSPAGHPLPPLPDGAALATLAPPGAPAVVRACVVRDLPLSAPAWASPAPSMSLRNLLTVCEADGSPLNGR